jgi:phage protein D
MAKLDFDISAPRAAVSINDEELSIANINDVLLISEYESALELADKGRVVFADPGLQLMDDPRLLPGSTIDHYFGYGTDLRWVGRTVVRGYNPLLTTAEICTLELTGYDGSFLLMEREGDGRAFGSKDQGVSYSEVATQIALDHGMIPEVQFSPAPSTSFVHSKESTDYQLLAALAAQKRYDFFVEWSQQAKSWKLIWGEPSLDASEQYEFVFDPRGGDGAMLKSIEIDLSLQQLKNGVELYYMDSQTQTWEKVEFEESKGKMKLKNADKVEQELTSAESLLVSLGETAIEVIPGIKFKSAQEANDWAQAWYRSRKRELVICSGTSIGIPSLRAGQVHPIRGIGNLLSGDYILASVNHKWGSSGYSCDFVARKVLEGSE